MATPDPTVPPSRRRRFVAGDPLRGFACLTVLVFHAALLGLGLSHGPGADRSVGYGFLGEHFFASLEQGLYVFFALSGYLIARPFIVSYIAASPPPRIAKYARSRLMRIAPPYYVIVTAILVWFAFVPFATPDERVGFGPRQLAAIYALAIDLAPSDRLWLVLGQTWTIGVEVCFYVAVPMLAWVISRLTPARAGRAARIRVVLVTTMTIAAASLAAQPLFPDTILGQRNPVAMAFAFAPGVLLVVFELTRGSGDSPQALARWAWVLLGLGVVVWFTSHPLSPEERPGLSTTPFWHLMQAVAAGSIVAAPFLLQLSGRTVWRAVDNRPANWLGERSYSFYLWHVAVLFGVALWIGEPDSAWVSLTLLLAIAVPLCALLSTLTYLVVERPAMRLSSGVSKTVTPPIEAVPDDRDRESPALPGHPGRASESS